MGFSSAGSAGFFSAGSAGFSDGSAAFSAGSAGLSAGSAAFFVVVSLGRFSPVTFSITVSRMFLTSESAQEGEDVVVVSESVSEST